MFGINFESHCDIREKISKNIEKWESEFNTNKNQEYSIAIDAANAANFEIQKQTHSLIKSGLQIHKKIPARCVELSRSSFSSSNRDKGQKPV